MAEQNDQADQTNELLAPPRWTGDLTVDAISMQEYMNVLYGQLSQGASGTSAGTLPRGWIDGLVMANDAANPNRAIDFSTGKARADDDGADIALTTLSKILQGPYAAGDGGAMLDVGINPAASTWYHIFAIANPSSGQADMLASASFASPTMPAGFSKKRRIGSIKTDASGSILGFVQTGDEFLWKDPPLDVSVIQGASRTLRTLTVPPGIKMLAIMNVSVTVGAENVYLSNPGVNDEIPSLTAAPLASIRSSLNHAQGHQAVVRTDTSARIACRSSAGTETLRIATLGWVDPRGRDAG